MVCDKFVIFLLPWLREEPPLSPEYCLCKPWSMKVEWNSCSRSREAEAERWGVEGEAVGREAVGGEEGRPLGHIVIAEKVKRF
jgi:hypothetical protein